MKFLLLLLFCSLLSAAEVNIPKGIDHSVFDRLLSTYVNDQGLVDYQSWKDSPRDLEALETYLAQFNRGETFAEGDERIAGLINAYNAFTLHQILQAYPLKSIRIMDDPFTAKRHAVGGRNVSLDEIEHDTLRPLIGWKVHALVVCAARSCPPLSQQAFVAEKWEQQMEARYRIWLAREDLNQFLPEENKAEISKIFEWYAEDFKANPDLKEVLKKYAPDTSESLWQERKVKIRYLSYHWGLNDQSDLGKDYKHSFLKSLF